MAGDQISKLARTKTLATVTRRYTQRRATRRQQAASMRQPRSTEEEEYEKPEDSAGVSFHVPNDVKADQYEDLGGEKLHQSLKRSDTYNDPDGLEDRDV